MKLRLIGQIALLGIMAAALSGCANGFLVKTGNVGLVANHYTGRVDGRIRHAGYNAQPPFSGNELIEIPTYERTYTMVRESGEGSRAGDDSVLVNTLSPNNLNVDVSITYHITYEKDHPEKLFALYSKYRNQFQGAGFATFEEMQLRPLFRKAISNAFGRMTTLEAMTGNGKRQAAQQALAQLDTLLNADSVDIDEVRIRAVYPDSATQQTLRSHLQAEQNLRLAKLNQDLDLLQNQKEVLKAQAEAQAARIRAASLTPRLVKFRHMDDINFVGVAKGAMISVPAPIDAAPLASGTAPARRAQNETSQP